MIAPRAKVIITIATLAVIVAAIVLTAWLARDRSRPDTPSQSPGRSTVTDFASCAAAGYPVAESAPRTCRADDVTYTEKDKEDALSTVTLNSEKGVSIRLHDWTSYRIVESPLELRGEVPGNWSFEASFPVSIADDAGVELARESARLQGDWMTTELVPFTVQLSFEAPATGKVGTVILHKDNPSGLPENDDVVKIPVTFR